MGKFTVTQNVSCNTETFWNRFFDKDVTRKAYLEKLGYLGYDIVEQTDTETEVLRKAQLAPKLDLPAPVVKILGTGFCYIEEGRFDKATQIWRWKRIPSKMADKLRFEGTLRVEAVDDATTRYISEIQIEAKIFGIGGLMESVFEKTMREETDRFVAFINSVG